MPGQSIRKPMHAGTFYPASREALIKAIEDSFLHPIGPGRLPTASPKENPPAIGYIAPHAGYMYSGPVAAYAYLDLAERKSKPDVIVIAGPNHNGIGLGAAVYRGEAWETPLGSVPVDNEIGKLIVEYTQYYSFDNEAHIYEHSVEVQIPFIQYIYNSKVPIVPISIYIQTLDVARDLGKALARIRNENGIDAVFIASTDFNHYEPHNITVEKDELAISAILDLDDARLYKVIEEYNITMCGPAPAAALINYALHSNTPKPLLLKHATSGDVTGEKDWVVGYASIKFPIK